MTGLAQVNLWFPYSNIDFPFINHAKLLDRIWEASSASEDHYALFDSNGYPTRMASGAATYRSYTSLYLTDNDPWVLTWTGAGTCGFSVADANVSTSVSSSANRKEYTYTSVTKSAGYGFTGWVEINSTPVTDVKLFRKSYEASLNAGDTFNPHFLERYADWGRIRFMDWQATNDSCVIEWAHRTRLTEFSWVGVGLMDGGSLYCGRCSVTANAYTAPNTIVGSPASWMDGMTVQVSVPSLPVFKDVTGASNANPAQITAVGHGFSTGDVVFFQPFSLSGGQWGYRLDGAASSDTFNDPNTTLAFWTVTSTGANTFTLDGVDSTTWGTYSSGGKVAKMVTVATSSLPAKRIVRAGFGNLFTTDPNPAIPDNLWTLTYSSDYDALIYHTAGVSSGNRVDKGLPIEVIVDLCNELNVAPWVNIGHLASNDYATQFATYLRDNLNTGLEITIEFSNEVWNTANGFSQTGHASAMGKKKWAVTGHTAISKWYGWRYHGIMTQVSNVFSAQMSRLNRTMAVWTTIGQASGTNLTNRFEAGGTGIATTPASLADSLAIAPYYETDRATGASAEHVWNYKQGGTKIKTALEWAEGKWTAVNGSAYTVDYCRDTLFPAWNTAADSYGLRLTQYEGGFGSIPVFYPLTAGTWNGDSLTTTDRDNFIYGFYNSRQFSHLLTQHLHNFIAAGGEYPSQYTLVGGDWSAQNVWGMIHNSNIFGSAVPALSALEAFNSGKRRFRTGAG